MRVPYTIVLPTAYGLMLVNRNDINQTQSLLRTGRSPDHEDITLLAQLLTLFGEGRVVIDAGANFGSYALGLQPHVGARGKVIAFEAQRILFNMLCGSVALNALENVYCYNAALGDRADGSIEVPQFDYGRSLNFGSIEFGSKQQEPLHQQRAFDPDRIEHVPVTSIDALDLARVDMIKIDVEGMELEVLRGAERTIERDQPILYVEFLKVDREGLARHLTERRYTVITHKINYLGIPERFKDRVKIGERAAPQA